MQIALFIVGNLLALGVSAQTAELLVREREPWRRLLVTLAGFPVAILLTVRVLGVVGALTGAWAVGLLAAVFAGLTIARGGRIAGVLPGLSEEGERGLWGGAERGRLWPLPLGALAASWLYIATSTCLKGVRFCMDDLSYHAAAPAQWLLDHALTLAPFNYHAYFPFNAECLSLWFMLPMHSDVFANLTGLFWATLTAVALVGLGLALGRSQSEAALPAAIALALPIIVHQATGTFSAVDLAGPVAALAALALLVPSPGDDAHTGRARDALLAGLIMGVGVGAKASLLVVALVPLVWLAADAIRSRRWTALGAYVAGAFAMGAYWYLHNWGLTGNPVFPAEAGPFAGPLDALAQRRTALMRWLVGPGAGPQQWWFIVSSHLNWPALPGVLAVAGYVAGACKWRQAAATPDFAAQRRTTNMLLAAGAAFIVMYPLTPFSGAWNGPDAELEIRLRYVILPLLVGLALYPGLLRGKWRGVGVALGLVAILHGWLVADLLVRELALGLVTSVALVLAARGLSRLTGGLRARPVVTWALLVVALAGVFALSPRKQRATAEVIRALGSEEQPVGRGWDAANKLPDGARIAWFGPDAYRYYPLYGRRLQHQPVPVMDDGSAWRPLHEWWREIEGGWWQFPGNQQFAQMGLPADTTGLVDNLLAAGVEYVFVTGWEDNELPEQHFILEESGRAEAVYDDGCSAIWRLKP